MDVILQNDSSTEEDLSVRETGPAEETEREEGLDVPPGEETGEVDSTGDSAMICVYICGAVKRPGVYELQSMSRLYELVDLAGGLTEEADECSVNLARTLEDGEMIRILTREESAAALESPAALPGAPDASGAEDGKVNINTADVAELITLNGIGEAKAAAIVAYREEHGFFKSIEEIMEVSGIGESTFDRIREEITV